MRFGINSSLVKDLNPVIDVTASGQAKVKHGVEGQLLFQVTEISTKDIRVPILSSGP